MAFNDLDRLYCFSLGDFTNFERCYFDFLVKHHLQQRYEIEEGSVNQAIGNLLDLVMKIIHRTKAHGQPLDYLLGPIFRAAENEMREKVERAGKKSFYGATIKFLTPETINKAKDIFTSFYQGRGGKLSRALMADKFWECLLEGNPELVEGSGSQIFKIWGGPDALEMGEDGIPEIVDYKYRENGDNHFDMDLMPKVYTLLCAGELQKMGYQKVRFRVRSWTEPKDESLYEEFDLETVNLLKDFFRQKIQKMLSLVEVTFCEKPYCRACNSKQRSEWFKLLQTQFGLE